jgi:hypothetical protein
LYETACIYSETLESRIAELKRTETALARSEDSRKSFEEKFGERSLNPILPPRVGSGKLLA